jgi:hypothetical protein
LEEYRPRGRYRGGEGRAMVAQDGVSGLRQAWVPKNACQGRFAWGIKTKKLQKMTPTPSP